MPGLLQTAGALAIFAAVGHGYLGDQTLRAQPLDPAVKNFVRCCYQFGTAGWLAGGVLLLSAEASGASGRWVAVGLVPLFGFASLTNLWFTRGRHLGWVLLAAVCVLVVAGAS